MHLSITFLAPSFDTKNALQQITSDASASTITVYIPQIDDSDGPIRYCYMYYMCSNNEVYAAFNTIAIIILWSVCYNWKTLKQ